ncbi:preprotein translocase subunit SecG [Candidatus Kuenenbacteria bacterium RIFCSPHIGHO2_12_FULL_42_14]|uniref:Protein-export membrane protein SecG n=4 Tax=Candidatus Kueneniibacteriota TaxID=1752740 RepID=A0A0G0Z0Y1_9BACT|nr:MAG: Preprotein translocase, SecG subunit [Candidatus Kuenenbacteria bacterium GW2011_GWA2_42_15]OGG89439.1 MAG: preprotein translocase subunit SecG [Candidatus Kuenenbacteria bacterium RIFCSPHIGHO2_02_FULL_42_29]OGG90488.1 MAG: preprotein translocase subunit SecG [Candidatus Kuenenbacteria bacterium RIFCSPLOWO2_02_FULL_42_16]OGG95618.1 MAG: preprotein translocase subunit SecG [Candidatus Kuenenbacteria bacterium RBG_16_41_7]OGG98724.1 MAG: preprotein translocase subunit SecG [Candidatus Kue
MQMLDIIQIVIAILLIITILLQNRGSGLGSAFGGEGNIYMAKRGAEKFIFFATIALAVAFLGLGVARIMLQ